jgi:hypothetical protein
MKEETMLQEHQAKIIHCAFCGANAIYDTDNEKIVKDWNIDHVQDPCDPDCHCPEEILKEHDSIVKSVLHPEFKRLFADHVVTKPLFRKGIL